MTARLHTSILVAASPADAFALFADYRRDGEWRPAVVSMTVEPAGPLRLGSQITEVVRFAGRDWVTPTVVTAFAPGRSLHYEGGNEQLSITGARVVSADAQGARIEQTMQITMRGAMRLFEPVLAASYRRLARQDLARLAALLDRRVPRASTLDGVTEPVRL